MSQADPTLVSSQGFEYGVKHFYNQRPGSLTELLFSALNLAPNETIGLLKLGAIYVNNQRQTEDTVLTENNLLRVHTKPRRYLCEFNWLERVVFENQDFIVINKPSGIPSHPSVDNVIENSLTQMSLARGLNLQITHRLDTLTAGLIVYAKTPAFVKGFNQQIQLRAVEKRYVALVDSKQPLLKKVIHYMEPSPRAPKTVSEIFTEGWVFCELEILEQKITAGISWLRINLLTGRTHQIRAQLSHLGAPILGDKLYGSKCTFTANAIALRAAELQFNWQGERFHFALNEDFDNY